ncbi:hypothetical protein [Hyphobacterium marinum]|uniref:DUF2946 domain-containing protein n=1 Tax=Hyphobacterium marinum TaxID=3116574 RepID=A0ABU7LVR2_9PROT|nr:hypothetical protein [Hyphobacterium sp. Y6023]MEE2565270.1 hypothetical protein [Hyphobacterium sp. Y6023]
MARAIAHRRMLTPARWRAFSVGLLAALALCLQGGAALAHTHSGDYQFAGPAMAEILTAMDRDGSGGPHVPSESGTPCPLSHSPLGHGGLLAPAETLLESGVLYAADNVAPPGQAPPAAAEAPRPPARAPPQTI